MRFTPPPIVRGIPIPPAPPARKKKKRREYQPSPWIAFLARLKPGDIFKVRYPEAMTASKWLEHLDIKYEKRKENGPGIRFWIITNDYIPPFNDEGRDI